MYLKKAPAAERFFSTLSLPACVGLAFVFFSWHFPLHITPWTSWHSESLVFFGVFLSANWLVVKEIFKKNKTSTVEIPFHVWPFVVFGIVAVLHYWSGLITYSGDIWVIFFYVALCLTCVSLGYACKDTPDCTFRTTDSRSLIDPISNVKLLACVVAFSGVCSAVLALVQILDTWHSVTWVVRGYELRSMGGNLAQPNHLALLFVMATASLIYLRVEKIIISNTIFYLLFGFYCVGLTLSESRAGLIGMVVLLIWSYLGRKSLKFLLPPWHPVLMIFIILLAHVSWPTIFNYLSPAVQNPNFDLQSGIRFDLQSDLRLVIWPQLLTALTLQPWAGWGILQVAPAQNAVASNYTLSQAFTYSHNIVLDSLIWLGIPLGLVFASIVLAYISRRMYKAQTPLDWYCLAMILSLLVSSQFEFQYAYAFFLAPVLFCWGASLAQSALTSKNQTFINLRLKTASFLLICLSAAMVFSAWEYLEQEQDIQFARLASVGISRTLEIYRPPQAFMLNQLGELANSSRIKITSELSVHQLQRLKNIALRYPWTATQYRYALALALRGEVVEAERQMLVMRAYYGHDLYAKVVEKLNLQLKNSNVNAMLPIRSK